MANKNYFELLKHPNWQKKRLEILQRDNFTCKGCGDTDKTLNIHHKYYDFEIMPWEYTNNSLITLCDECHKHWHDMKAEYEKSLIKSIYNAGFEIIDFYILMDIFEGMDEKSIEAIKRNR